MIKKPQRIHFIASGGSIMHSLAIALKMAGNAVTGSDDHFFEPSRSKLAHHGLLPENEGWDPHRISADIDFVVLGMHAKADNPELLRAQELKITVYSFPEYIYQASKNKQRVVIAGSHGKTTTTSMVMHVLGYLGKDYDYMVGAQLEGYDNMVKISDAPVIIIEGDEYTTSPLDLTPKFLHYKHHIALLSGIAWDHYNVYPTLDNYVAQFEMLLDSSAPDSTLVYCNEPDTVELIKSKKREGIHYLPYSAHPHQVEGGKTSLIRENGDLVPLQVFGQHNMENLNGAFQVLKQMGISEDEFYVAIQSFKGASKRLQTLGQGENNTVYLDFAHAPSKLKATASALKAQFEDRTLVTCVELHTFSSLNKDFIHQYANALDQPDEAIIFIDPAAAKRKGLEPLSEQDLRKAFKRDDIRLINDTNELDEHLRALDWDHKNLALMSSGNFGGLDFDSITTHVISKK